MFKRSNIVLHLGKKYVVGVVNIAVVAHIFVAIHIGRLS